MIGESNVAFKVVVIIFAIIGLVAVVSVLGMWFTRGAMMGMMSMGGMQNMAATMGG